MKKNDLSSIVVKGTDWFANLAVLNLCWLLFSLPVVTLIPATDAVFDLINKWVLEGQPSNVFKSFIASFKENFGKSFRWGIPLLLVIIILIIDLYFLNQLMIPSAWFSILKYAFYTFAFLLVLAILYGIPVMKRTGKYHVRMIIFGLMLAIKNPLVTLGVIASVIVLTIIYMIWPSMLFFFVLTGIAWVMTKAVSYIFAKEK